MANEEGVKIILTAEDRYTATIKKIEASTKIFGETVKNTEKHLAALEKEMIRLVALGIDPMSKSITDMKQQYDKLKQSLDSGSNSIKSSSKTWTNLSLVVQDLPYGFRGIQNNLPALVGSFAAASGAIYFGFSALISITTAYEKEIVQLIYGIDDLSIANKKMNSAISDNIGQAKSQIASDQALLKIINDSTQSTDNRKRALKQLKEEYKGNIELQKIDINDAERLASVYGKIENALLRKARAQAYAGLIAEEEAKIFKLQTQEGEEVVKNLGFTKTVYGLLASGINGVTASSNIATAAFSEQAKQIKQSEANIALYTQKLNENTVAQIENADAQSLDTTATKKKSDKAAKEAAKLAAFAFKRVAKAGGDIEVIIEPEIDPKAQAKAFNEKMAFDKKMSKERVALLKQQYELEVSEAQGSFEQIRIAEENMRNALNQGFMDGSIKLSEYLDAIQELRKKSNKTASDEAKKAMQETLKIGIGIMNALGPALDMLLEKGASLGEVLSRAFTDVLKKLAKVAIAAAIAVAIMSMIPGLIQPGKGLATFGNLVGQGMGLGAQLFANGGIISGPTLGLMGEYPGAANNPEVVAPLDKLQSLIGGSWSGTLEARISGNDLLILMNKAGRNNNNTF